MNKTLRIRTHVYAFTLVEPPMIDVLYEGHLYNGRLFGSGADVVYILLGVSLAGHFLIAPSTHVQ